MIFVIIAGILMNIGRHNALLYFGQSYKFPEQNYFALNTNVTFVVEAREDYPQKIKRYWHIQGERIAEISITNGTLDANSGRIMPGTTGWENFELKPTTSNSTTGFYKFIFVWRNIGRHDNGKKIGFGSSPKFTIYVRACVTSNDRNAASDLVVFGDAKYEAFNEPGHCSCRTGYGVVNSSLLLPTLKNCTTCDETGIWRPSVATFSCWFAPNPVVLISSTGRFDGIEGDNIIMNCLYNDVNPAGNTSMYNVENLGLIQRPKGKGLNLTLTRELHGARATCQPVTPLTLLNQYNSTATSRSHEISVSYSPSYAYLDITGSPEYVFAGENSLNFFAKDRISLDCIGDGNPSPRCDYTICSDGSCKNIAIFDVACNITLVLRASSTVFCKTYNEFGSEISEKGNITLIPARRTPTLVISSTSTNVYSIHQDRIFREGDDTTLSCSIDYETELSTNFSIILPNNITILNSSIFLPRLEKSHTGKFLCRTNDAFGNFQSLPLYINVQYAPQMITWISNAVKTKGVSNTDENLYFIRTDEVLSMECVTNANPEAKCLWIVCDVGCQNISTRDNACKIALVTGDSVRITFVTYNSIGSLRSVERTINTIPAKRKPIFFVSHHDSNARHAGGYDYLSSVTLFCAIPYQKELGTKFTIRYPNSTIVLNYATFLPSLTHDDDGTYTCTSNDSKGIFVKTLYLSVRFPPVQPKQTSCVWIIGKTESCEIRFLSQPRPQYSAVTKNGVDVEFNGSYAMRSEGKFVYFTYRKEGVQKTDNGTYAIRFKRGSLGQYSVYFDIIPVDDTSPKPLSSKVPAATTASISVGTVALFGFVVFSCTFCFRRRRAKDGKEITTPGTGSPRRIKSDSAMNNLAPVAEYQQRTSIVPDQYPRTSLVPESAKNIQSEPEIGSTSPEVRKSLRVCVNEEDVIEVVNAAINRLS